MNNYPASYYIDGIVKKDRIILSQTITLLESKLDKHINISEKIIDFCLTKKRRAKVIGVTGIPGVGKSSFINALGTTLLNQQKSIAVLTVDPSSFKSNGSILADKTRMTNLVNHNNAYIRSSASKNFLGGLKNTSYETILLCDIFGFDYILVESVGVGQSEIAIQNLVDMVLMITVCNTGDELQGIKRGIMEIIDAIIINKIDISDNVQVKLAKNQLQQALHLQLPKYNFWKVSVVAVDSISNKNIIEVINIINDFFNKLTENNRLIINKNEQKRIWLQDKLKQKLLDLFLGNKQYQTIINDFDSKSNKVNLNQLNQIIDTIKINIKS